MIYATATLLQLSIHVPHIYGTMQESDIQLQLRYLIKSESIADIEH